MRNVNDCLFSMSQQFELHTTTSHIWSQRTIKHHPFHIAFYTPVWKTDVLCRGNVRPSVRPRFPDFSSTCYDISIWNLIYTSSRCHDMPSLSCITIGSLWSSLQPKVGQTNFLQSWPHKSRYIIQILYTGGLLYTSRHKFRFCENIIFGILAIIFACFGFFEASRAFFYMFWYISLKLGIYMQ